MNDIDRQKLKKQFTSLRGGKHRAGDTKRNNPFPIAFKCVISVDIALFCMLTAVTMWWMVCFVSRSLEVSLGFLPVIAGIIEAMAVRLFKIV